MIIRPVKDEKYKFVNDFVYEVLILSPVSLAMIVNDKV